MLPCKTNLDGQNIYSIVAQDRTGEVLGHHQSKQRRYQRGSRKDIAPFGTGQTVMESLKRRDVAEEKEKHLLKFY